MNDDLIGVCLAPEENLDFDKLGAAELDETAAEQPAELVAAQSPAPAPEPAPEPEQPAELVAAQSLAPAPEPEQPDPAIALGLRTIEVWREVLGTPDWLFAGMKLGKGWAIGQQVTQESYEAAVLWAANVVVCR